MELNVTQSGIVDRLVFSTNFKIKNRCLRRTVERYLREDLSCGLYSCESCAPLAINNIGKEDEMRLQKNGREKVLHVCANYLKDHWAKYNIVPVILCAEDDVLTRLRNNYDLSFTIKQYVESLQNPKKQELLDSMAAYLSSSTGGKIIYENYLSHDEITKGIALGHIKKGTFSKVCLRDVEDLEIGTTDNEAEDVEEEENVVNPKAKRAKLTPVPTAKVVGIMKRNWRPYCGILMRSQLKNARRHLFCPSDRLIPRIRIETEQADILESQRIVVSIDQWPRDSRYPLGHYVRALGKIGDREIENEVLLLEHDIPHAPFSDAVLECLPGEDWRPDLQPPRVDLRHLTICSVDPLGCTDIDDALHCRALDNGFLEVDPLGCTDIDDALHCRTLDNGFLEVGVHIADVTHFVRSGTAIDEEAASRGTTVYLCDRRIDMLPEMLSSNLCSLRGGEERYAFSVIWTMTKDAEIIDTKYHKSLICSKAALTYEQAQEFIDNENLNDDVTIGLRGLMKLSKILNKKRTANGALTLASSEIRFDMDWETRTPKAVQEKKHLDTHSMVEEFMLLANISVAEKILAEYPDCAMLRRHPVPTEASYKPLVEVRNVFDVAAIGSFEVVEKV
ncbi:RNB-like protein [Oesophagostomum dentatum]|uniref:Protein DIS3 homolog n=1 Tax=Oesophagostomum dentatum TaxID=61180 RepID=A0A0B1SY60_OESDE|nr:RNB-like protein [Oesophagostomum dentatum]